MTKLHVIAAVSLLAIGLSAAIVTTTQVAANGTIVEQDGSKAKSKKKNQTRGTSSGSHSGE